MTESAGDESIKAGVPNIASKCSVFKRHVDQEWDTGIIHAMRS